MEKPGHRLCPECGKLYKTYKFKKVFLGGAFVDFDCTNGHTWTEAFTLTYTGYSYNNKYYDRFGEELDDAP